MHRKRTVKGSRFLDHTTSAKQTSAKSQAKINYRRLTEINSRYYGLSLMRTPAQGLHSSRYKGSEVEVNTKVTRGLELRLRKTIW